MLKAYIMLKDARQKRHLAERAIIPPETVFCTRSAVVRATDGLLT